MFFTDPAHPKKSSAAKTKTSFNIRTFKEIVRTISNLLSRLMKFMATLFAKSIGQLATSSTDNCVELRYF